MIRNNDAYRYNYKYSYNNIAGIHMYVQRMYYMRMYTCICMRTAVYILHYNCLHFSICACHPCAGAMLIFSASFQFNG